MPNRDINPEIADNVIPGDNYFGHKKNCVVIWLILRLFLSRNQYEEKL